MRLVKNKQGVEVQSADPNAFAYFAGTSSLNSHSHISYAVLNSAFGPGLLTQEPVII